MGRVKWRAMAFLIIRVTLASQEGLCSMELVD
jgi:hypothetical protein